jgi:hypothetical protein
MQTHELTGVAIPQFSTAARDIPRAGAAAVREGTAQRDDAASSYTLGLRDGSRVIIIMQSKRQ